jgi:Protein of unknown function (DUF2474)
LKLLMKTQALPLRLSLWLRRLGWLVLLWLGGVAALAFTAGLLRLMMQVAGMRG